MVTGTVIDERLVINSSQLVDLGSGNLMTITESLQKHLLKIEEENVYLVLIEQQNKFNPRALVLSHCLQMFFLNKKIECEFVSPLNKFKYFVEMKIVEEKNTGKKSKKIRKQLAANLLKLMNDKLNLGINLKRFKKLDDIGDCLIYLFNYFFYQIDKSPLDKRSVIRIKLTS